MFEVRVTPLIRGVPGLTEKEAGGLTPIDVSDTVLIPQFHGLRCERSVNDGCIASVKLSMHWDQDVAVGDAVEALDALTQALWIGFWRPGENLAEAIFWGQCNVLDDFGTGEVELVGADPYAGKARSHYIRRGDPALNIDSERGSLPAHAYSAETIFDAARNTPEQQDREMPAFAMRDDYMADFGSPDDAAPLEFERGQEVYGLHQLILDSFDGPDADIRPPFFFPSEFYAFAEHYKSPQHAIPAAGSEWGGDVLGRNLDPADPDDPQPGEVVFQMGYEGNPELPPGTRDNITACRVDPSKPITHQHYLDASRDYRVTVADAASSYLRGAWVGFNQADFTITRSSRTTPADTTALLLLAKAIVAAYGVPPKHITVRLRKPDLAGMPLYGHPLWPASVPEGVERTGGDWYLGDYVRVRARKGRRSLDMLARITKAIFTQDGSNDLPEVDIELIPAEGGTPGPNTDHPDPDAAPTVAILTPLGGATVDDIVTVIADAEDDVGVVSVDFRVDGVTVAGGFSTAAPWQVAWDSSTVLDGPHTLTAVAADSAGNMTTSTPVVVTVANAAPPETPPPEGFASRLAADGLVLSDGAGHAMGRMTGVNVHCLPGYIPTQDELDEIRGKGASWVRVVLHWPDLESVQGVFSATMQTQISNLLARCEIAGLYAELELHLNIGSVPGWTTGVDETAKYAAHGQFVTQRLAQLYGGDPVVLGFGLNETPLGSDTIRNGMNAIPYLEGVQRTMIGWFRAYAPDWIGFVTLGYANQTPYPDAPRTPASPTAYDSVGGNVVLDVHHYQAGVNSTDPNNDGRQPNGMIYPTYQGGSALWQTSDHPLTFVDTATHRAQMLAFLADYVTFCNAAQIPLMIGELGWTVNNTGGKAAWWDAMMDVLASVNPAMAAQWMYSIAEPPQEYWPARPDGVWDPDVETFLASGA